MSNFNCETCVAACLDSPRGYVTGCEHNPADLVKLPTKADPFYGDLDKPVHRPECRCGECESWWRLKTSS